MAFSFFLESQSTCAHKLAIPLLASVMVSYGIWPTLGWKFNFPQHYLYACTAFCQAFPSPETDLVPLWYLHPQQAIMLFLHLHFAGQKGQRSSSVFHAWKNPDDAVTALQVEKMQTSVFSKTGWHSYSQRSAVHECRYQEGSDSEEHAHVES